jgi:hypothetical protein
MTEPSQLTIDGRSAPRSAREKEEPHGPPEPLFTAPQTMRGQLAMNQSEEVAR